MSVCGCTSSSPVSSFLEFAEHAAEKIGDGVLNAGFGAIERGIDFAEHGGEALIDKGRSAMQWAEHLGQPLIEIGCEVAQKAEQLGQHLGNTLREDSQHLGAKLAPIVNEVVQLYGRMEAERAAERERAREGIAEGLEMLLDAMDASCGCDETHVNPSNGQFTEAGDPYGVG